MGGRYDKFLMKLLVSIFFYALMRRRKNWCVNEGFYTDEIGLEPGCLYVFVKSCSVNDE